MTPSALLALMLIGAAPPGDTAVRQRAEQLVNRLGDRDYRERERAAKELLEIGYPAREAVLAGQKNPDGEISERCRKLYPEIFRRDLEKRVAKFIDNPDGPIPDDLPGAARWIKVVGDGKQSRELYAEMVKAHSEPLLTAELHPERTREVYIQLMRDAYTRMRTRPVGGAGLPPSARGPTESEVLLFLFLGSAGEPRTRTIPGVSSAFYYQFLTAPDTVKKLSADPPVTPFRKLYAAWLEKERVGLVLRRALDLAAQYRVKECAPVALKAAGDAGLLGAYRGMALIAFGRLAGKEDIKDLLPFLKDETLVGNVVVNGQRGSVQMRDVALGAAIHLAALNPADFGFERRPSANVRTSTSYTYYAFGSDEKRDAAHAKWKEWAKMNLKD